jgi:hypothetical protein
MRQKQGREGYENQGGEFDAFQHFGFLSIEKQDLLSQTMKAVQEKAAPISYC